MERNSRPVYFSLPVGRSPGLPVRENTKIQVTRCKMQVKKNTILAYSYSVGCKCKKRKYKISLPVGQSAGRRKTKKENARCILVDRDSG